MRPPLTWQGTCSGSTQVAEEDESGCRRCSPLRPPGPGPTSPQGPGPRQAPLQPQPFVTVSFSLRSAFDLVNIHLFHDASNLVAWETSPSVYSGIRHKALGYVLDR